MKYHPVVPWIGGKGRISDWILSRFPVHKCYVEAFCGAAAIYFTKPPSEVEVINDINGELVNMYRVIQHHPEEMIRQFKWALSSRQFYEWEQRKDPATLTDIQRAARFYYLQKQAFGGRVDGQSFGTATTSAPRLNLFRLEEDLSQAHLRLQGTYVENLPWDEIIRRYDRPHTLFYLDPPYWNTEGYGVNWTFDNYERMAILARESSGMMMISVNDIPEMREVFSGLYMDTRPIKYTVGGGAGTEAQELLIWNDQAENAPKQSGAQMRLM
ncbi:DNA adenine methylase [Sedimenticola selenatireducens]|uniref:site-specific DNA-methyltransferase (adenine-specific) n=1 Tax=Sedimenticola selenatireducens TaxID=191960 RepID=A0A557S0L8_9GAMM|nr:DNA adenine methylase [Sedimenticola selenatireducens]TVO70916.1 DNA adenine methylase [Sedimenticola selenatireducens]